MDVPLVIIMVAFGVGLRSVFSTQNNESFSNFASTFKVREFNYKCVEFE